MATRTKASKPKAGVCNVEGCTREAKVRGLCNGHYASRRGDADPKES